MKTAFYAIFVMLLDSPLSVRAVEKDVHIYSNPEAWRRAVPVKYRKRPEYAFVKADPDLPNVLLIGDSISMQYTMGVREKLAGIANVYRAPDNCRSTRQTRREIDKYLGEMRWDVIHFNWGIHDLTHLNASGKVASPPGGMDNAYYDTGQSSGMVGSNPIQADDAVGLAHGGLRRAIAYIPGPARLFRCM